MKKLTLGLATLTFFLCLSSCSSDHVRAKLFVETYNKSIGNQLISELYQIDPNIAYQTDAAVLPAENGEEAIGVSFYSRFRRDDPEVNLYKQMIPAMFASLIMADKNTHALIESGAKLKISYYSRNKKLIHEVALDQQKLKSLLREDPKRKLAKGKGTIPPEISNMLIAFNNSLPIVIDPKLEIKIVKIDLGKADELVYEVEVGDAISNSLRSVAAKQTMKQAILSEGKLGILMQKIKTVGLNTIRYTYRNKKGEVLSEISFNEADLVNEGIHVD
ncbi:MAG: hypothetical protein REI78_13810 [Pedobacter sp.]|nr:hypothetical protein [Pedobacter sp.]MDQ8054105.1 hypothetical protein [Pedobacter sp.]